MTNAFFVTGATGFLGRRFLVHVEGEGSRVTCLRRPGSDLPDADVTWVEGDLETPASFMDALPRGGAVLHMAAVTGKAAARHLRRVHIEGTRELLDASRAADTRHFVFVSTIAAKFRNRRHYPYAQTKLQAEQLVRESGIPHTIVRPTIIMGPGAPVVAGLRKLASAPFVPVFGNGRTSVQPVDVDDLARLLVDLLKGEALNETIEIGGLDAMTIEELLLSLRRGETGRETGREPRLLHLPARPISFVLACLEPCLRPLLPLTAGQIKTFTEVGTAANHPWMAARRAWLTSFPRMLERSLQPV